MFYEAFLAGIWASVGSTLGKLSGTNSVVVSCIYHTYHLFDFIWGWNEIFSVFIDIALI